MAPDERTARIERLVADNYDELRRIARARLFRSGKMTLLQTTDLVNETFLRLSNTGTFDPQDRFQFLAYAARAIRSIIVDYVRTRDAERHGGEAIFVTLATGVGGEPEAEADVLSIDAALAQLRALDEHLATIVELRFFVGLSEEQIAQSLGISERTVRRHWEKARRILATILADDRCGS